ncbi:MAG: S9 family peptidase, partial [Phycisphaerales bacterium]
DGEKAKTAPRADDGVSGDWEGLLTDGESLDLPPDGLKFDLSIEVDEEGAVTGTLRTPMNSATITDGKYDKATGSLTCTLTDSESGMTASLSATVKDQTMTGTITIAAELLDVTLKLTADRTAALQQEEEQEEEEDIEKQQEEEEDTGEQGDDQDEDQDVEEDDETDEEDEEEEKDLGDVVDDKDADDEKAPRYGGVSTYVWAPEACELIFTSGGDLYQYDVEKDEITRLTMTQEGERGVQYLPDGSGYTLMRGRSVMKVTFGSSLLEQIDPKLPGGEEFSGYRMSPDGQAIAFLTTKGSSPWEGGRKVNIINYRNRFAEVRQVNRHMSDDPRPKVERTVYIYDMRDHFEERGVLSKLFTATQNMPRDFVGVPEWSLDSSRVCFSAFDQATGQVKIFEANLPEEKADADDDDDEEDADDNGEDEDNDDDDDDGDDEEDDSGKNSDADDDSDDEKEREKVAEAKVVYQFFHNGGPNTPRMIRPAYLADDRRIVFISELSGFRHLHVLDPVYEQLDQLTRGRFEVYPERLSKDHTLMFATATKGDPSQRNIYRIDLAEGEMTRLDHVDGTYSTVAVSNDGNHALANFVDYGSLTELVAIDADAEEPKVLTDSHPEEAKKLTEPIPEFFTFENRHGQEIHGHMFKPDDWTPQDKRPLLIYVYGGPLGTRKMVTRGSFSSDSYFFAYYLAKKHGYVTCTIDPRGASGYGGLFEKSNYEQVGKPQVEDLVDGAKWFIENQGVDPKLVGIHGWSFGGFQTQMCLYTEPDVFACGMAGAGPTEWENYNSWYSMATIGPSREGKTDLEKFSLLPLAKNLKAKLLLVHGMEDANVLYQDTVRVYRELLKAGKEALVELFLDPTGGHGLGGDVKRINRFRKYEEFLLRNLGEGKPAVAEAEEAEAEAESETAEETEESSEDETDDQEKEDTSDETDDDGLLISIWRGI